MTEIEAAIRDEIAKALEWLGASPRSLARLNGADRFRLYDAAEQLGADRYLLAYIGSWAEDDIGVLAELREWNAGEAADAIEKARQGHGAMKPPAGS